MGSLARSWTLGLALISICKTLIECDFLSFGGSFFSFYPFTSSSYYIIGYCMRGTLAGLFDKHSGGFIKFDPFKFFNTLGLSNLTSSGLAMF